MKLAVTTTPNALDALPAKKLAGSQPQGDDFGFKAALDQHTTSPSVESASTGSNDNGTSKPASNGTPGGQDRQSNEIDLSTRTTAAFSAQEVRGKQLAKMPAELSRLNLARALAQQTVNARQADRAGAQIPSPDLEGTAPLHISSDTLFAETDKRPGDEEPLKTEGTYIDVNSLSNAPTQPSAIVMFPSTTQLAHGLQLQEKPSAESPGETLTPAGTTTGSEIQSRSGLPDTKAQDGVFASRQQQDSRAIANDAPSKQTEDMPFLAPGKSLDDAVQTKLSRSDVTEAPPFVSQGVTAGPPTAAEHAGLRGLVPTAPASTPTAPPAATSLDAQVGTPEWNRQIGAHVAWMVSDKMQGATLTINPPELGTVTVHLTMADNVVHTEFAAAEPQVRAALDSAIPQLRNMLHEAGIELGNANVGSGADRSNEREQRAAQLPRNNDNREAREHAPEATGRLTKSGEINLTRSANLIDIFA